MEQSILFWTKVAAIGQVAGALATAAAVIVALLIAQKERRFAIRVTAKFGVLVNATGSIPVMTYTIENIGLRPVEVTGMHWATGYRSWLFTLPRFLRLTSAFQLPDYEWVINQNFPWKLEPGQSKSTHMRKNEFVASFVDEPSGLLRKVPWAKKPVLLNHRVGAGIATVRKSVLAPVDRKVTKALTEAYLAQNPD